MQSKVILSKKHSKFEFDHSLPHIGGFSFTKRLFITDLVVKESPIEFMALDWPERQLSAEVESSSSFQSRDS